MKVLLLSLLTGLISSCSVFSDHRDWSFIQSVGGIIVNLDNEAKKIILSGDVSGLYQYSYKPTKINSGIAVKNIDYAVIDNKIQLYIVTTLVSEKYANTKLTGIDISELEQGTYQIQYLNPNGSTVNLKEVQIK